MRARVLLLPTGERQGSVVSSVADVNDSTLLHESVHGFELPSERRGVQCCQGRAQGRQPPLCCPRSVRELRKVREHVRPSPLGARTRPSAAVFGINVNPSGQHKLDDVDVTACGSKVKRSRLPFRLRTMISAEAASLHSGQSIICARREKSDATMAPNVPDTRGRLPSPREL